MSEGRRDNAAESVVGVRLAGRDPLLREAAGGRGGHDPLGDEPHHAAQARRGGPLRCPEEGQKGGSRTIAERFLARTQPEHGPRGNSLPLPTLRLATACNIHTQRMILCGPRTRGVVVLCAFEVRSQTFECRRLLLPTSGNPAFLAEVGRPSRTGPHAHRERGVPPGPAGRAARGVSRPRGSATAPASGTACAWQDLPPGRAPASSGTRQDPAAVSGPAAPGTTGSAAPGTRGREPGR